MAAAAGLPLAGVDELLAYSREPYSIDAPPLDASMHNKLVTLADPNASSPLDAAMDRQMRGLVSEAMDELNARERKVVCKRFGFGTKPLSLQQVGEVLDLSRERVRQIEKIALAKMLERIEGQRPNRRPRSARRPRRDS